MTASPLAATPLATLTDADLLGRADPARTVAVADLSVGGAVVARPVRVFRACQGMGADRSPARRDDRRRARGLCADRVGHVAGARVWIDLGDIDATLSDNAFDLAAGDRATITIRSTATLAALRQALSVRSLFGATRR